MINYKTNQWVAKSITNISDWLLNRRHCGTQWQASCLGVREKINNAIQDMPEHPEITQLLAGTCTLRNNKYIKLRIKNLYKLRFGH